MSTIQPRRPAGIPVGGQFANKTHPEPGFSLDADEPAGAAPVEVSEVARGRFRLAGPGLSGDMHSGGRPHERSKIGLVGLGMQRSATGGADGSDELRERVAILDGEKATVLVEHRNGVVEAVEGTVEVAPSGSVWLRRKGAQTNADPLYSDRPGVPEVLDVEAGFGHAETLAQRFAEHLERAPRLAPASFDGIPADDGGEPPSEVAAVFVIDHPGFDGDQDGRGCVFFATDRDPENAIVNGYLVAPAGSGLESEHGSLYERTLAYWGGRVASYRTGALSFGDAITLGNAASDDDDIESTWARLTDAYADHDGL